MKSQRLTALLVVLLTVAFTAFPLLLSGCDSSLFQSSSDEIDREDEADEGPPPPDQLMMIRVPVPTDGIDFPRGENDGATAIVEQPFYIAETEVTYRLWRTVYDWATSEERGDTRYTFGNPGRQGGDPDDTILTPIGSDLHPVTRVSITNAVVWCNALTEWHNHVFGTTHTPVYSYLEGTARDSGTNEEDVYQNVQREIDATGFRLPSQLEWELAARWRDDEVNSVDGYDNPWFTKGNSASGAPVWENELTITDDYTWWYRNTETTQPVKTKTPNALGLYDMSGNVWEFVFHTGGLSTTHKGWSFFSDQANVGEEASLQHTDYGATRSTIGFRVARNAD